MVLCASGAGALGGLAGNPAGKSLFQFCLLLDLCYMLILICCRYHPSAVGLLKSTLMKM